ncbi:MAG: serine dehydratase subunit alpha family protein [Ruminococcaceae bacterium]|nr:serine dehydratase subunit alpha family protein [Oscillospiraceae bacterium]
MEEKVYEDCIRVLREELRPALGCTEPIAVAYAAAKAREALGTMPESVDVSVSRNIIKNVKSVIVPNTGDLHGLEAAAAAGIAAGEADAELEVLKNVSAGEIPAIHAYLEKTPIRVSQADTDELFYIEITVYAGNDCARSVIKTTHTDLVVLEKNGVSLLKNAKTAEALAAESDRSFLSLESILDFANCVPVDELRSTIGRQIEYNSAIAAEGIKGNWGGQVGKLMMELGRESVLMRAAAMAAAGSDARMSGCEMPVIIVSGSGNQGITTSLPVIEYARAIGSGEEQLYRALVVANLVTIHQKTGIGRLSAFCGAISAGVGAACGIAYLEGQGYEVMSATIKNALAITSGMICDGAKGSCAAKIAASVTSALLAYQMAKRGREFQGGDGILKDDVEDTIAAVGTLARRGMQDTDKEIVEIMLN